MKIEVHTTGVDADIIVRQFIHRKIKFSLGRIKQRVEHVIVKLEDESCGSHNFDGLCRLTAWLIPNGQIHVSAFGTSPEDTFLQAITKLESAILNEIERNRQFARIRREKS